MLDAAAESVGVVAELLELSLGVLAVERWQDDVGIAVEGLSGQSEEVSTLGDRAVGSCENSSSMGDTEFGR